MKWRSPWAEQLSVPMVAFCTAFALHVAAAHFSHSLLTTADGTVVLCLATGTSVGIALVANGARARWAALIGGVIGEAVFLATVQLPYGNVAEFASHITEASIAFCSLYLLTTSRFSSSLGPTRSIAAMTFCISAATLGALPAALPDQSARFILDWGLGHGIGIFAMTSAIVAFVLREPRALPQHASRRTSLVGALLAIAVIVCWRSLSRRRSS